MSREVHRVERLRDVVEPARTEAASPVAHVRASGQEDDRDAARRLVLEEPLGDRPAVEARHHHVEKDRVRPLLSRELEPDMAVLRLEHPRSLGLEVDPAEKPDRILVVDHEHGQRHQAVTFSGAGSTTPLAAAGSSKTNVEPWPSFDSTQILPPIATSSPRARKRPSPVPCTPTPVLSAR